MGQQKTIIDIAYEPTDKQSQAHSAFERYILYGGAIRGGKTWWLCMEAIQASLKIKGNVGLLCRHRLTDFKTTTLQTLQVLLPPGIYEPPLGIHHQTDHYFRLINGSIIHYGGLGDYETTKQRLGGLELGWFAVDQAEEISESQFDLLTTRLTLKIPGIHYHGFLTANPDPGWLRDRFIDNCLPDHRFIPALPKDNPHLPANYEEELRKTLPEGLVKQLLKGQWDIDTASNYLIPYSKIREAIKCNIPADGDKIAGVDISRYGDDETVFILRQGNRVLHIEAWAHQDTTFSAGRVARLLREHKPAITYIDSVGLGAGVFDPLKNEGFAVEGVNVGESALDSEQFFNKRAEYFKLLAQKFEKDSIDIPDNTKLASQLASMKYTFRDTRLQIESKERARRRGIKSPDYADALMLAFIDQDISDSKVIPVRYW